MSQLLTDDFSRLQNQSRIPATTWRHWCNLLNLDPIDAVDVWEEICHPIMAATRKIPEVPLYPADVGGAIGLGYFRLQRGSTQSPSGYHFSLCAQRRAVDQGQDQKRAGQILPQDGSAKSPRATPRFVFTEISRQFMCGNIGIQGFTGLYYHLGRGVEADCRRARQCRSDYRAGA